MGGQRLGFLKDIKSVWYAYPEQVTFLFGRCFEKYLKYILLASDTGVAVDDLENQCDLVKLWECTGIESSQEITSLLTTITSHRAHYLKVENGISFDCKITALSPDSFGFVCELADVLRERAWGMYNSWQSKVGSLT